VHQLCIDFKKVYDSFRREGFYNILIGFGIPMKLIQLLTVCVNDTYSRVRAGKNLNVLLQEDILSPLLFNFVVEYAIRWLDGSKFNGTHHLFFKLIVFMNWVEAYIL